MVDRHMSLKELADEVGISNVNLSKIKNNRVAAIRFTTLAGICEALECQPGDILKYEVDEGQQ
ncbi:helix-turn-helix transcriptional regulator [Bifidobacterium sp. ESL0798]|uniref:helix-turn-helix domain-containing protein n=1 Tax=Bifidobacterium sp. ESL0798 TaxID=2983235 RepID=UPI0023FA3494|nr:helix-turn-helix transcriptional regulator [Bifidobacterium sp. ESL0798]WEV74865.1 helix-turn-helix transcriptional regulator [Bifidobacterium sp. ESL0798]